MVSGVNQNIEVFGRVFLVETDIAEAAGKVVRTVVSLDGSVIAARDTPIPEGDDSEARFRELIDSQHGRIVSNLLARDAQYEITAETGVSSERSRPAAGRRAPQKPTEISLPGLENDPVLHSSVRVRRLIGPFSLALRPSPDHQPSAVCARLERAAEMVENIISAPAFSEIRLDEQVRFVDLDWRLKGWRSGGRDPEDAARILLQMIVFAGHLRRINDRQSLMALDRTLLTWALFAVGPTGSIDDVVPYLQPLYGRDADLDRMIDDPSTADPELLKEVLRDLLERTQPGDQR